ncbi:TIGR04222 domain-containing membrane protein [Streptomyces anulatus]|uniref:TIGR04222 domain-containing membrane protein n=1 Tax=Streptomyces anulatus TaxID=1892 RepID=UPI0004C81082|nr:TIGR04222 domain-containing membrane protein [Streptomyces anulatus]
MYMLALLATLVVAVSSVALLVKAVNGRARRPRPAPGLALHDLYEAAFLNGGPARVVDTALAALHTDGRLVVGGPGIVAVQRAQANDPVERAVLQELAAAPSGALHVLREAAMRHPAVQETGDGLAARGLIVSPLESRPLRRWATIQGLACVAALPLSVVLTFVQFATEDGPFPFVLMMLPPILIGGFSGLIVAATSSTRITKAGRQAALAFRNTYAYVVTPAHLVATLGLRALPDPVLQAQLAAAARLSRPRGRSSAQVTGGTAAGVTAVAATTLWCAASSPDGSSCGGSSGGSGSGCGGGSGCSSGSGCGGGSGSSCGSSGGSSCGSSGGSSCGGGGS